MLRAIGVEKEIFPGNSFSTHHGYRKRMTLQPDGSKLHQVEKLLFEKLFGVDFQVIFLNMSTDGFAATVCMPGDNSKETLNLIESNFNFKIQHREWFNGFSVRLSDLDKPNYIHRELYPKPDLRYMKLNKRVINLITDLRMRLESKFICLSMNCSNEEVLTDEIHLELYFDQEEEVIKNMLNVLETRYKIDTSNFASKLLDVDKFSHLKVLIKDGEINKIKYYRSINAILPDYYYVESPIYI